jgi:hypothetical protein
VESKHDSCVLVVGDRVVVRADAGPLDAEYALFVPDCIELRTTDPGAVREAGYRTTAAEARERLAEAGLTPELAEAMAETVRAHIAGRYARGAVVRRAVSELGAAEMFEGRTYLSAAHAYEGQWLDLAALQFDVGDASLARTLQAMHLSALLAEVHDDADVYLATLSLTQNQRPGVRTFKRLTFPDPGRWAERFAAIGESLSPMSAREAGPTRVEVLDWLSARAPGAASAALERAERIARATGAAPGGRRASAASVPSARPRQSPRRGPLSDPVAWSIEAQLDAGELDLAAARIDMMERDRGSIPCVVYLRSRASLMLKREDPQVIAERVSMLAATGSFDELELLAAQAWAAAGNMGRALPYARVLAANPLAAEDLRERARQLADAASARPPRARTAAPARGPSGKRTTGAIRSESPERAASRKPPDRAPQAAAAVEEDQEPSGVIRRTSPLPAVLALVGATPSGPPTPRVPSMPPDFPARRSDRAAPKTQERELDTLQPPPPVLDDMATAYAEPPPSDERTYDKGISRPSFRAVSTNSTPPRLALGKLELAESFEDPAPPATLADARVRAAYEARLQCTAMARELGMLYRTQHGVELRTDLASLEAIQAELSARYHDTGVRTVSAMMDLRRHGAFVSEVLARTLRATWLDVGSGELGHWTMFVPPDTRVWPFARVLRFVTMGSRERDLVAYYLELHARSC